MSRETATKFIPEEEVSEEELIERTKAKDESAFRQLQKKYRSILMGFIIKRVKNKSEAEDIFQETWINAYKGIDSFESRSNLSTWVITIALNIIKTKYRDTTRKMKIIDRELQKGGLERREDHTYDLVEEKIDKERMRFKIYEIIEKNLTKVDQKIIKLWMSGESYDDILKEINPWAETLKNKMAQLNNLKSKIHRIKEKLKPLLEEAGFNSDGIIEDEE
ncbi:MAG: RNA polymerase sigma factor [bacterium]|nr:RNA polymerase sigma factor [bacterium]